MIQLRALINLSIIGSIVLYGWLLVGMVRVCFFDHNAMGPMDPIQEKALWRITPTWIHPRPATWTRSQKRAWERAEQRWRKKQAEERQCKRAIHFHPDPLQEEEELVTPDEVAARAGIQLPAKRQRSGKPGSLKHEAAH